MTQDYAQYYLDTIKNHQTGLKLVLGPTGLGKTHGIRKAICHLRDTENPFAQQGFIYLTHRHQLLSELERDLNSEGIPVAYLKSDGDILTELANKGQLADLLSELEKAGLFQTMPEGVYHKDAFVNWQSRLQRRFEACQRQPYDKENARDQEDEQGKILRRLRRPYQEMASKNGSLHKQLLKHKATWQLFPYVRFLHDPERPVLLATIQKAVMGFFTGSETARMLSFRGHIVFLDEMDFLEADILNCLAQESALRNPFEFVATFLENAALLSPKVWESYPEIQNKYSEVESQIRSEAQKMGLRFPQLRRFAVDKPIKENALRLFRSGRTLLTSPFSLSMGETEILVHPTQSEGLPPWKLLNWLQKSVHAILSLMHRASESPLLMDHLLHEIWNCKNDNASGEVERYIRANHAFRSGVKLQESHELDFAYQNGYTLFSLKKQNDLDPNRMELTQLELSSTPEMLLLQLAQHNLVFGLSATADFTRKVRSLNLDWISSQLKDGWLPVLESDFNLIEALKAQKDAKKYPQGTPDITLFDLESPISYSHEKELNELLDDLYQLHFFHNEESDNQAAKHRRDRTLTFFKTLTQIAKNSQVNTHLLFLDSFKREKQIFVGQEPRINSLKEDLSNLFQPQKTGENQYKIVWEGKRLSLIFLDAEEGRKLTQASYLAEYDKAFTDPETDFTLLITQYATASNGVNLRCLNKASQEIDFQAIHLLERKHFWLELPQLDDKHPTQVRKKLFWYLWKLSHAHEITESRFLQCLREENLKQLTQDYENCREYPLNLMALIYQALGRIDRKWATVDRVEVGLSRGIFKIWRCFLETPDYQNWAHESERKRHTATLLNTLQTKVESHLRAESFKDLFVEVQDITEANRKSQQIIRSLLDEIEKLKKGVYASDSGARQEIRDAWAFVRKQVLKQGLQESFEFKHLPLARLHIADLAVQTPHLQSNKTLWVSDPQLHPEHKHIIYPKQDISGQCKLRDLDQPYQGIDSIGKLRTGFLLQGYPVEMLKSSYSTQSVWTPYIEQAILRGVIGEEAISLVLKDADIHLQAEKHIPDALFEVFDVRLQALPWYLDFKNFTEHTLGKFGFQPSDWEYESDFDSEAFVRKVSEKLKTIRTNQTEPNAKYIVINLFASSVREMDCFDIHGTEVSLENADLVYIPGVFDLEKTGASHPAYLRWLDYLKQEMDQQ